MSFSDTKESNGMTNSLRSCIEVSIATLLYGLFDVLYAQWAAPICDDKISQNGDDANEDDIWRRCPQQQPTTCGGSNRLSSQIEGMFLLLALRAVPALIFLMCTILLGVYDHDLPDYSKGDILAILSVVVADWFFNIAMCIGLVELSPLWVTMGTILCVPAALIFDMLVKGLVLSLGAWIGGILTAVGFIVYNIITARADEHNIENSNAT
ncbi:hypothetical protein Pmar_PMAR013970 [Perkinsus marinus ATCC 50983]|uniref:Uncharacterized protein n=1 Tax=Perkinsus marinus (strain ATCC 50983 / TXsc) TaxID=423536 RepID=C5LGF0_PERM5|nr:hypothetical protein Pmar_PMAR013970 [Perkinsus marinus ATCC 50983]EER04197.1 hypothetical protein Pmar_PMAR013970 [Perkinsus marinus ATCC 50983]|mmetsp:Transcript_14434/g.14232  ORF Transcript_14434/g.14232 Transcript_14434/m.14232 type:complete len:210 (-) Transcript_14434:28-657(-)|eukprot:XP_002772381.1 hypothetical protein Pmar_PMAR013970 [Perkinsus marinus ATCC 50983]